MDYPRLISLLKRGEGSVNHLYLDTVGKVTVGVGNMLPTAESAGKLPFRHRFSDNRANINDIIIEYGKIKQLPYGKDRPASFYAPYCELYLPEREIDKLLGSRVQEFLKSLRMQFRGFDDYPEAAQLGIMDMIFNLGPTKLFASAQDGGFPKFCLAVRQQDWATCANECHRRGIADERNNEVKNLFLEAA